MKLSGKLTAKALGWDRLAIATAVAAVGTTARVNLGRFVGVVTDLRHTIDQKNGEIQTGLKGNFRGISTKDGLEVTSGVCYLPSGIQSMIEGSMEAAKEKDPKASVQFALDLFALHSTNAAGYTFEAQNIVQADAVDPLAALLESANAITPLALAAPAPAPMTDADNIAATKVADPKK